MQDYLLLVLGLHWSIYWYLRHYLPPQNIRS